METAEWLLIAGWGFLGGAASVALIAWPNLKGFISPAESVAVVEYEAAA